MKNDKKTAVAWCMALRQISLFPIDSITFMKSADGAVSIPCNPG